jgi:hypothetical protein
MFCHPFERDIAPASATMQVVMSSHHGKDHCSAKKMPMANGTTTIAIGIFANNFIYLSDRLLIVLITIAKIVKNRK